jgi:hypothetical protein
VLQQLSLLALVYLAALAAFTSAIPAAGNRARRALLIPGGVMLIALIWGVARDLQQLGTLGLGRETDWQCVLSILVGGVVLWGGMIAMLRRGAALEPRTTSVLTAAAALGLINIGDCISKLHRFTATVVVWHGLTVAVVIGVLALCGPLVLTRRIHPL